MKIISKYKDYYDYLGQIYGIDNKVVYKRNPKELEFNNGLHSWEFTPSRKNNLDQTYILRFFDIWFCDENYPFIEIWNDKYPKTIFGRYYNYEELFTWKQGLNWGYYKDKQLKELFKIKLTNKLNTLHNSPQILTTCSKLYTDVILKDYKFQTIISPEQAFQRVSMFIAAKPDVAQTVPTDMHRFEAKGFDKKTSFRNM